MSDFDKEREREKLRKKFAEEDDRRETTEQMSELLLQGATMLNVHCADCKAPLFRQNGEEFCPTCGRTPGEAEDETEGQHNAEATEAEATSTTTPPSSSSPPRDSRATASLEAAIARLADQAATADDPRTARDFMEAVKDGAEALAMLEGRQ